MPPDIAMNSAGSAVMITRVNNDGELRVTRFSLTSSTATTLEVTVGTPILPPRIAFAAGNYWVLIQERVADSHESFSSPRWELARVLADGTAFTNLNFAPQDLGGGLFGIDIDDNDETFTRAVATEFDFDCITYDSTTAHCTIVALLRSDDADVAVALPRSIRFSAATTGSTATMLDATWDTGSKSTNGVIGATAGPAGIIMTSLSRPITAATTQNTEIVRHLGGRIGDGVFDSVLDDSDATACTSTTSHGFTMGAVTTSGGYSIAWCPTCGGAEGTVESVSWSAPNDGFCF